MGSLRPARPAWTRVPLIVALLVAAVLSFAPALQAQSQPPAVAAGDQQPSFAERVDAWDKTADAIESLLEKPNPSQESLSLLRQEAELQRVEAAAAAQTATGAVAPLEAQLQALGPKPEDGAPPEAREIAERRAALEKQVAQAKARVGEAQLASTRAASLAERLAEAQRRIFTERLLSRGPQVSSPETWWSAMQAGWGLVQRLGDGVATAAVTYEPLGRHRGLTLGLALILVLFLIVRTWSRAKVEAWLSSPADESAFSPKRRRPIPSAIALMVARAAPVSAAVLGAAALIEESGLLSAVGALLVWRVAEGIALVASARAMARLFFAPRTVSARIVDLGAAAWPATGAATRFFLLVALGRGLLDVADAAGGSFALLTVMNALVAMAAGPVLYGLVRRVSAPIRASSPAIVPRGDDDDEVQPDENARPDREVIESAASLARLIGLAIAFAIPVSAVLGYFALSRYLLAGAAMTLGLTAVLALIFVVLTRWAQGDQVDGVQRSGLVSVLVGTGVAIVAAPALAAIWGATGEDLRAAFFRMLEGVQIGDLRLTLADFLIAILVAVIGFWLTRFAQGLLRRAILPQTRLDTGVQTSVTTGVGYIGALLTILVAVSAIGLDLSSLAIVAGALSVGIGFGLQAIVNNFVSGVILLIERPVRVGDWIEVGGAQGVVQRINVRSTEIETFDRQSVIVPNSELLSNHLTNYTHRNLTGRVHCTVGVAYDADPEQVMEILRDIARAHPQVLRYPQPLVTFNGFGDSSLDFELRAFIRDVNWKLVVTSDLNVAILKALREAGIEIPYPQRDLHLRSGLPAMAPIKGTGEGNV